MISKHSVNIVSVNIAFILTSSLLILPALVIAGGQHYSSAGQDHSSKHTLSVITIDTLSQEEREWFDKFQKGSFLVDGWQKITADILAKVPENEEHEHRLALRELGNKIGCEWSRDNEIRKIDSKMLRQWGVRLKKTVNKDPDQLPKVIAEIDRAVVALLN